MTRAAAWLCVVLMACKSAGGPEDGASPASAAPTSKPEAAPAPDPNPSPAPAPAPEPAPAPNANPSPAPEPDPTPDPNPPPRDPSAMPALDAPPPPGPDPDDPRRACKKDADCELLPPRPCTCTPCGSTWREALNVKTSQELQERWARRRCRAPNCPQCVGRYLGDTAVCESGSCVPR